MEEHQRPVTWFEEAFERMTADLENYREAYPDPPTTPSRAESVPHPAELEPHPTPTAIYDQDPSTIYATLYNENTFPLNHVARYQPQSLQPTRDHLYLYWQIQRAESQLRDTLRVLDQEQVHRDFLSNEQRHFTHRRLLLDELEVLEGRERHVTQVELDDLERRWAREEQILRLQLTEWNVDRPAIMEQFDRGRSGLFEVSLWEILNAVRRAQVEEEPQWSQIRLIGEVQLAHGVQELVIRLRRDIDNAIYTLSREELALLDRILDHASNVLLSWDCGPSPNRDLPVRHGQVVQQPIFSDLVPALQPSARLRIEAIRERERDQHEQHLHDLEQERNARQRRWNFRLPLRRRRQHEPGQPLPAVPSLIRDNRRLTHFGFANPFHFRDRAPAVRVPRTRDLVNMFFSSNPATPRPIESAGLTARKPLDDHCAICLNGFGDALTHPANWVTWCLACGQNAHSHCILAWHEGKERHMRSCPFW